jgi:catechol 2,3-dioxygenase-like lactoylglutathione lyase family enzyme
MKVGMVQINVPDLDKAVEWYTKKLDFEISKEHYHPPVAIDLVNEGIRLLLYKAEKETKIDYPKQAQSIIIFETEDLVEEMKNMKKNGVELIYDEPIQFPAGIFTAFRDPFGNVHEVVEFNN